MKYYQAPDSLRPLIVELGQIAEWQKQTDKRVEEIWKVIDPALTEIGGKVYIDRDTLEKSGAVTIVCDDLEIGRNVSNYGSKVQPEDLYNRLVLLVKEGVLNDEERDSIVKREEKVVVDYVVNETELMALATEIPDVAEAVKKATSDPEPKPIKINVRKAKGESVKQAVPYFATKVETQ